MAVTKYYKIRSASAEAEGGLEAAISNALLGVEMPQDTLTRNGDGTAAVRSRPSPANDEGYRFETWYLSKNVISEGSDTFWGGRKPRVVELDLIVNGSEGAIANFQKYLAENAENGEMVVSEAKTVSRATLTTRGSSDFEDKIDAYKKDIESMPIPQQVIESKQVTSWKTDIDSEYNFHCGATYTGSIPEIMALREKIEAKAIVHKITRQSAFYSSISFE